MKLTIGKKIGSLCVVVVALLALLGGVSFRSIGAVVENIKAVTHTLEISNHAAAVMDSLREAESMQRGYLLTGKKEYLDPFDTARRDTEAELKLLLTLTSNAKARELAKKLESLSIMRLARLKDGIDLYNRQGFEEARKYVSEGVGAQKMTEITQLQKELGDLENELLQQRQTTLSKSCTQALWIIGIGVPVTLILVMVYGFLLMRNIAPPLQAMTRIADQISHGVIEADTTTMSERSDEIGSLSRAFINMQQYLRRMTEVATRLSRNDLTVTCSPNSANDLLGLAFSGMIDNFLLVVRELQVATQQVAASTTQISTMTTELAASASQTATAINETTTTVEEVKVTANQVNQKSGFVSESARRNSAVTMDGRKSVEETLRGMQRIKQQMDFIAESVVKLSEQSMAISEIISSVSDLASQSNILAVNASIEAAKAGEQGKGFAVVAQEVRSLAEQSKDATEQIRGILNDVQKAISSTVMATEQGGKIVESGVRQAGETETAIQTLEQGAVETVQAAAHILASTNEQVVGLNQVAVAMDSIRTATDQIVLSSKQAEESMTGLERLGRKLKELADQFKVR